MAAVIRSSALGSGSVEPEQWMAVDAIITPRKGHAVLPDGSIGAPSQTGNREPRTLLTGVLRCGKPKPDGSICNVLMRTNTYYRSNTHVYTCPGKTQGGCGGVARNGPRTDEYVTEAVPWRLLITSPWMNCFSGSTAVPIRTRCLRGNGPD